MPEHHQPPQESGLIRALGVPALTANIVNTTIGASIFVLPATIATMLGGAAPIAFVACAIAQAIFVTCFAIAGSRVSLTGGLYAYVEVAFGRYVGFLAGLMNCTTAILSVSAVMNVLAGAAGSFAPFLATTRRTFFPHARHLLRAGCDQRPQRPRRRRRCHRRHKHQSASASAFHCSRAHLHQTRCDCVSHDNQLVRRRCSPADVRLFRNREFS